MFSSHGRYQDAEGWAGHTRILSGPNPVQEAAWLELWYSGGPPLRL